MYIVRAAVLLADENDQRPYDPFGDDDDVTIHVTSSAPVIPATKAVTTSASMPATVSINIKLLKQNWLQFLFVGKATATKQQKSKFYPQILSSEASYQCFDAVGWAAGRAYGL